VLGFLMMAAGYALVVESVILPERDIPVTYKQYLLKATSSIQGRVVIDGGSNSHHSINATTLSNYWHAPLIITAENGGYQLRNRIFNLRKYLHKGDILILPLEWGYYVSTTRLKDVFLARLTDPEAPIEYLFNGMPALEKLRLIFTQLPLRYVIASLLAPRWRGDTLHDQVGWLTNFEERLQQRDNESFGGSLTEVAEAIDPGAAEKRCDQYVHQADIPAGKGQVSSTFLSDLDLLREMADSGIAIYFTWPAVVDRVESACYRDARSRQNIQKFADQLVAAVEARGFSFIGNIEESHFGAECFLDTYYHLRHSCAMRRTTTLIETLEKSGVVPKGSASTPDDLIDTALVYGEQMRQLLRDKRFAALPALGPGKVDEEQLSSSVSVVDGWYGAERVGMWSRGPESVIELKIAPRLLQQGEITLYIDASYAREGGKTEVTINGRDYGVYAGAGEPYKVSTAGIKGQRLTVKLRHENAASPATLGIGPDQRTFHLCLRGLTID